MPYDDTNFSFGRSNIYYPYLKIKKLYCSDISSESIKTLVRYNYTPNPATLHWNLTMGLKINDHNPMLISVFLQLKGRHRYKMDVNRIDEMNYSGI